VVLLNFLRQKHPQLSKNLLENFWSGRNTVRVAVDPVVAPEVRNFSQGFIIMLVLLLQ
jgi:hypothetical protein